MGDSGSRRSTLVSRLPIFRRSISRRHDSLPSSPSSGTVPGVHSSSPSSTNSSSGSTGKRRSIFRTPSISFRQKKGSEPNPEALSQNLNIGSGAPPGHGSLQRPSLEEHAKARGRHSVGFSSSRSKKLTRSWTEDFKREKEPSANKNVFINCLSSGKSEGEDSGFTEESAHRSVRQSTKKLLTKSFSSHYKLAKPVPQSQSVSLVPQSGFSLEINQHPKEEQEAASVQESPSGSGDVPDRVGSSLHSPLLSADATTAQTPSEFLTLTEDSMSEADVLPPSGSLASHGDLSHNHSTSRGTSSPAAAPKTVVLVGGEPCASASPGKHKSESRCSTQPHIFPGSAAAQPQEVLLQIAELPVVNGNDAEPHLSADTQGEEHRGSQNTETLLGTSTPRKLGLSDQHKAITDRVKGSHPISDSRIIPSARDHHTFNKTAYGYDPNPAKVLASSFSPYREGRFMERRLRSSSEGTAGSSRMVFKPKDGHVEEGPSLRKQRAGSSSSKMNSMDVLNNLGSCELDEDDLMLDLEFLEDQNLYPPVCREDSYHSVVSCAAVVLTPMEPTIEMKKREDLKFPEPSRQNLSLKLTKDVDQEARCAHASRMPSSPSTDYALPGVEENGGLDSLPFRLMLQDCTAVKTLLLKMKRVLQESADMSPARSTSSLPVSPLTEEPLPFKDIMKDECSVLKLQLKERDELISQLQEELEKVQHLQKAFASRVDKSTQTEVLGYDALWNPTHTEGLFKPLDNIST